MTKPLLIDYYTDILCVWAWVAQSRIKELKHRFGAQVELHHHCVDVFGNVSERIGAQWQARGGYAAYAKHSINNVSPFTEEQINPDVWTKTQPKTSANAHLLLKAIELVHDKSKSIDTAFVLRNAFYLEALDISRIDVLFELIETLGLDNKAIKIKIDNGEAMAALMGDYQRAKSKNITGSPTLVLDNGRQTLYGNVGYRVIRANIEELLKHPVGEAGWC